MLVIPGLGSLGPDRGELAQYIRIVTEYPNCHRIVVAGGMYPHGLWPFTGRVCGRWIDMRDLSDVLEHERACDGT
jgi:hypothetical protein